MNFQKSLIKKHVNVFLVSTVVVILLGTYIGMVLVENQSTGSNENKQTVDFHSSNFAKNNKNAIILTNNTTPDVLCNPVCDGPW